MNSTISDEVRPNEVNLMGKLIEITDYVSLLEFQVVYFDYLFLKRLEKTSLPWKTLIVTVSL